MILSDTRRGVYLFTLRRRLNLTLARGYGDGMQCQYSDHEIIVIVTVDTDTIIGSFPSPEFAVTG
eukprot:scaffold12989_cov157-Skeletonema_menzelii.AAC.13